VELLLFAAVTGAFFRETFQTSRKWHGLVQQQYCHYHLSISHPPSIMSSKYHRQLWKCI